MKRLLIIALLATALTACGVRGKIEVLGEPNVRVESLSKMTMTVVVENRSRHNLRISEGRFRLHTPGGDVATAILGGEVLIPRKATTQVEFPLRVRFNNPLAVLGNVLEGGDHMMISGEAVVHMGAVRKKIGIKDSPVSEFLDKIGSVR